MISKVVDKVLTVLLLFVCESFHCLAGYGSYRELNTDIVTSLKERYSSGSITVPITKAGDRLKVEFGFQLQRIIEINEMQEEALFLGQIWMSWSDFYLKWQPERFGRINFTSLRPTEIWTPDIRLLNSGSRIIKRSDEPRSRNLVQISYDGACKLVEMVEIRLFVPGLSAKNFLHLTLVFGFKRPTKNFVYLRFPNTLQHLHFKEVISLHWKMVEMYQMKSSRWPMALGYKCTFVKNVKTSWGRLRFSWIILSSTTLSVLLYIFSRDLEIQARATACMFALLTICAVRLTTGAKNIEQNYDLLCSSGIVAILAAFCHTILLRHLSKRFCTDDDLSSQPFSTTLSAMANILCYYTNKKCQTVSCSPKTTKYSSIQSLQQQKRLSLISVSGLYHDSGAMDMDMIPQLPVSSNQCGTEKMSAQQQMIIIPSEDYNRNFLDCFEPSESMESNQRLRYSDAFMIFDRLIAVIIGILYLCFSCVLWYTM